MNTLERSPNSFRYPESRSGKIAVGLIAVALGSAGFIAAAELLISGMFMNETILDASWLVAPLVALALCGVLAAIASMVAVVVERDRSILAVVAFFIGIVITYVSINGL